MRYWIFKSEPSEFSIVDLAQRRTSWWDGVRNYQVRNQLRDVMQPGDKGLFYHSSCPVTGVAGEMVVTGPAVVDDTQFDVTSPYYDPKSLREQPRWLAVPVQHLATFKTVVPLAVLRQTPALAGLQILVQGNRLSITEVSAAEYATIVALAASCDWFAAG